MKIPNMKLIEVSYIDLIVYDEGGSHFDLHLVAEIIPGRESIIVLSEGDPEVIKSFELDPDTEVRIVNDGEPERVPVRTTLRQVL